MEWMEQAIRPVSFDLPNARALACSIRKPLFILDLEHSGYEKGGGGAGVVQLAVVSIDKDGALSGFSTLVNPECAITYWAKKVHGISEHDVRDAPIWSTIAPTLSPMLLSGVTIGFNIASDLAVIRKQNLRYDYPVRQGESLDLAPVWRNGAETREGNLGAAARHMGLDGALNTHDAWDDTVLTAQLLDAFLAAPSFRPHITRNIRAGLPGPRQGGASIFSMLPA